MSVSLLKIAAVLDATANHLDALEHEKASSLNAERSARIDTLASKYAEATGEEMPENLRKKLANSDKEVVELITSMATKQASAVEALGSPSERNDDGGTPLSVKEAAEQAEQRFLGWITS
jgi:hypothetical protein